MYKRQEKKQTDKSKGEGRLLQLCPGTFILHGDLSADSDGNAAGEFPECGDPDGGVRKSRCEAGDFGSGDGEAVLYGSLERDPADPSRSLSDTENDPRLRDGKKKMEAVLSPVSAAGSALSDSEI